MNRHVGIFMAGVLVIVPLAITAYVVWSAGVWLDSLGASALEALDVDWRPPPAVGAAAVLLAIYLVGLLTRLWLFRGLLGRLERVLTRLPGIRTVYQSVRDLMGLFGGDSKRMGRAVLYQPAGAGVSVLGILTNDRPSGLGPAGDKVAVYLPFSYMFGGPTVYVSPRDIRDAGMSVEQALKLAATAHVGARADGAEGQA